MTAVGTEDDDGTIRLEAGLLTILPSSDVDDVAAGQPHGPTDLRVRWSTGDGPRRERSHPARRPDGRSHQPRLRPATACATKSSTDSPGSTSTDSVPSAWRSRGATRPSRSRRATRSTGADGLVAALIQGRDDAVLGGATPAEAEWDLVSLASIQNETRIGPGLGPRRRDARAHPGRSPRGGRRSRADHSRRRLAGRPAVGRRRLRGPGHPHRRTTSPSFPTRPTRSCWTRRISRSSRPCWTRRRASRSTRTRSTPTPKCPDVRSSPSARMATSPRDAAAPARCLQRAVPEPAHRRVHRERLVRPERARHHAPDRWRSLRLRGRAPRRGDRLPTSRSSATAAARSRSLSPTCPRARGVTRSDPRI